MEHLLGLLRIHVHRWVNLVVRDVVSNDPYDVFRLGKQKFKTRVVKRNINPEWNEELTLSVADPKQPVRMLVYDKDTLTRSSPPILLFVTQSTDIDQIVTEHYQSGSTPQPSVSKHPVNKNNFVQDEELSSDCSHGLMEYGHKVAFHFGEKFDSTNCQKTRDNCLKIRGFVDKDVTETAKQLVNETKAAILFSGRQTVTLRLHGAGKHLQKAEASLVLRHLVTEDVLVKEVKKSDLYGSSSSALKASAC